MSPLPKPRSEPASLFGEILDWMLVPLLLLWPLTILITHRFAAEIAERPYDEALTDHARRLMQHVTLRGDQLHFDLPPSLPWLLPSAGSDLLYYEIRTPSQRLAGNAQLPTPPWPSGPHLTHRTVTLHGSIVRLLTLIEPKTTPHGPVLVAVQIAETTRRREVLATELLTGIMLPQLLLIPIALILVWFGLTRGLAPLDRLQAHLARRRPTDLSPLDPERVPDEIRPLILAFNHLMARLESNLAAQRRFIADAAHQLRTPLTGLKMQAELARDAPTYEAMKSDLDKVIVAAERAAHLATQMLTLARAEAASEAALPFTPTDLTAILKAALTDLYPKARRRAITLALDAPSSLPPILVNPMLLTECLKNLLDNAITYTPPGGEVTVTLTMAPSLITLTIDDTGPGIPPEERQRIFQPFVRLPTAESCCLGSGLGLAIVREILDLHRATITVSDPPHGRGTRFTVYFPIH
ncbi:MAG: sensor histidine kinase N-terminal domain-containing protein [Hydrogenophilus sp.]|nr:sensor histidine kinase N-terminal domain-containing protein [Hydrogenophilus sp.]